ncbi:MAG: polysaccharide deacetylase family protein, partial [Anaerolineae bacterium]|nr:polysaccharide deacetylase family protein [Anaerolineae bacterium]
MTRLNRRQFLALVSASAVAPLGQAAAQGAIFQRIPALEYHNINYSDQFNNRMTPEWFQEQMQWLGEVGYQGLNVHELRAFAREGVPMPEKSVILTFDLGRATSNLVNVIAPTLQQFGLHGIVYVQTPETDDPFSIDSDEQREWWRLYRGWYDAGVISYGSHSVTHRSFYQLDRRAIVWELAQSKQYLEEGIGVPVDTFAYAF